ncbi:MAG: transglutaminaseTgpA domain-containing protein, partial [Acidimicrobiales bacterium]|nr:transglutaminaseTgpA domain-containing protein [Acidimicrobiales bacterium]
PRRRPRRRGSTDRERRGTQLRRGVAAVTLFARVREVNQAPPPEESVALRVGVFVAVGIATLGALNLGVGGPAIRVASLLGIPGGYALSHVMRHRNRGWLKVALAVGAVGALAQFLGLFAPALAGQVFGLQTGLVELLLWVQILHSLDVPSRRDLLFSLATSGALLIVTAALATNEMFLITLGLWLAAAMAALSIASLTDAGARVRPRHGRGIPLTLLSVGGAGLALMLILPPAQVFAFSLPSRAVAGGVNTGGQLVNPAFSALPSAAGSGGGATGRFGYNGYTESLDLGFRGRPDNTLVMKVRAPGPDFWRAQSFDTFDGRSWSSSDTRINRIFGARGLRPLTPREDIPVRFGDEFIQTYFIEKLTPNIVFAAASPERVFWPFDEAYQMSDGTLRGGDTLAPGTVYSVVSRRLRVTPDLLRSHDPARGYIDPSTYRRYTRLPQLRPRVSELAAQLAAQSPTAYDTIQAMTQWIATNTRYSLNPPKLGDGDDAVETFLFHDQRGFCEQIATSLVVMLRSVGIPARMTVGYAPGKRNPFSGLYEVRASDAHAYTEVLFPGVGWQAFDPTAAVPLSGERGAYPAFAAAGIGRWMQEHAPSGRQAATAAAAIGTLAAGLWATTQIRRLQRRTWLDRQLASLQRRVGTPIDEAVTLPDWLARLPSDAQDRFAPVVAALEREAWSAGRLSADERAAVEGQLAR